MQSFQIRKIKAKLEPDIMLGDYVTLGQMLDVPQNTARMRYKRDNEEAVEAMKLIIDTRDTMIKSYKESKQC